MTLKKLLLLFVLASVFPVYVYFAHSFSDTKKDDYFTSSLERFTDGVSGEVKNTEKIFTIYTPTYGPPGSYPGELSLYGYYDEGDSPEGFVFHLDFLPRGVFSWDMYQAKAPDTFGSSCPGMYFYTSFNPANPDFDQPCIEVGRTAEGEPIYGEQDKTSSISTISSRKGDTLLVFIGGSFAHFTDTDLQEVTNIINSLEPISDLAVTELIPDWIKK